MCVYSCDVYVPRNLGIYAIWGSGIAHEFRLHARAASSSDVSAFATMSRRVPRSSIGSFSKVLRVEVHVCRSEEQDNFSASLNMRRWGYSGVSPLYITPSSFIINYLAANIYHILTCTVYVCTYMYCVCMYMYCVCMYMYSVCTYVYCVCTCMYMYCVCTCMYMYCVCMYMYCVCTYMFCVCTYMYCVCTYVHVHIRFCLITAHRRVCTYSICTCTYKLSN